MCFSLGRCSAQKMNGSAKTRYQPQKHLEKVSGYGKIGISYMRKYILGKQKMFKWEFLKFFLHIKC